MEFIIEKEKILKALSKIQGIIERRNTMPILANVLLEAKDNKIEFNATDLEVGIRGYFPAEVKKEGKVTLPARHFYDIIREMPDGKISFVRQENYWVEITSGKIMFKLVGMPVDEFPKLPSTNNEEASIIEKDLLKEMIEKTIFSVSTEETRYSLNGIYFETREENKKKYLRLVATDGHRLSLIDRELDKKNNFNLPEGVIIPKKGLQELRKLAEEEEGEQLKFFFSENSCVVEKDPYILFIRLIEGKFPNYQQVIPQDERNRALIHRDDFMHTLKRISLLSSEKFRGVVFSFKPNSLELSISNPDMGEAKEEITIDYSGSKSYEVRFNPHYIIDILNTVDDDKVVIELGDELGPGVFKSDKDKYLLNIVMPMRV